MDLVVKQWVWPTVPEHINKPEGMLPLPELPAQLPHTLFRQTCTFERSRRLWNGSRRVQPTLFGPAGWHEQNAIQQVAGNTCGALTYRGGSRF